MIKTYKNSDGGKVKVFFVLDDDNNITSVKMRNRVVLVEQGLQYYVYDYVAQQIDKDGIEFSDGKPQLIEKETSELPQKSEKEKEIERLVKELRELRDAE